MAKIEKSEEFQNDVKGDKEDLVEDKIDEVEEVKEIEEAEEIEEVDTGIETQRQGFNAQYYFISTFDD